MLVGERVGERMRLPAWVHACGSSSERNTNVNGMLGYVKTSAHSERTERWIVAVDVSGNVQINLYQNRLGDEGSAFLCRQLSLGVCAATLHTLWLSANNIHTL